MCNILYYTYTCIYVYTCVYTCVCIHVCICMYYVYVTYVYIIYVYIIYAYVKSNITTEIHKYIYIHTHIILMCVRPQI